MAEDPPRGRALVLALIALASGFSLMVVELSAVRVLAPSFGDSVPVWTNVIGVILLALALGAMLGGLAADRGYGRILLPVCLLGGAAIIFVVPFLTPRIANWILGESLPLDRVLPVLVEGSLAVGLLVFAPPVLLLGCISPILIELGSSAHRVGRISGLIYASGTIGSLLGTFLATHWLVPRLGLHGTFAVAGGTLVAAGLIAIFVTRRLDVVAAGLALLPAAVTFVSDPDPLWLAPLVEPRLLARQDSYYQRLWVVSDDEQVAGRSRRLTMLKINEGLDSFHSVTIEGTPYTNGRYYDSFGLLPALLPDTTGRVSVLSLGCATGSILRVLGAVLGRRMLATGVELDPDVVRLGRRYFGLPAESGELRILGDLDARVYIERIETDALFDLICLDTYRNQIYLPVHLASVEFFTAVKKRLSKGGVLALNVGDYTPDGPVLDAIAGTLASVFKTVETFRVAGARNFLVFAHEAEPGRLARALAKRSRPDGFPEELWRQGLRPGACRRIAARPPHERLTDERSALGRLHERIYSRLDPGAR